MRSFLFLVAVATCVSAAASCTVYSKTVDGTCAQSCLNSMIGICPVALVAKAGGLDAKACSADGYTQANGTKSQKAGPCGTLVFNLFTKPSATVVSASTQGVPLAKFDGSMPNTWKSVDDPVMGGQSKSHLAMDTPNKAVRWYGQVKLVPFLHAPGFCTFRSNTAKFPDASGTTGLHIRIRNNMTDGLKQFTLQLTTKGGRSGFKQGTYSGNITVPMSKDWIDVSTAWDDFDLTWRGEKITGPKLNTQLDQIQSIGVSTFFPGKVGQFDLEVQSLTAQ